MQIRLPVFTEVFQMKVLNVIFLLGLLATLTLPVEFIQQALPAFKHRRQALAALFIAWIILYELRIVVLVLVASRAPNPERAVLSKRRSSVGPLAKLAGLMDAEKRFWLYALTRKLPLLEQFEGRHHFGNGNQNGNADAWLGWAIVNFLPTPIIHIMLHHKSPLAAALTSFACFMSSLWLWAEYRAAKSRPISFDEETLYLRYGLLVDREIDRQDIVDIKSCNYMDSFHGITRHAGLGAPNVILTLRSGERIAIGVDEPTGFIQGLRREFDRQSALRAT